MLQKTFWMGHGWKRIQHVTLSHRNQWNEYITFRKKATSEIDDVKENAQKSFAYWSRRVQSKWAESQVKFRNFEMNFLKKSLIMCFPQLLSWYMHRMTTKIGAFESPDLGALSRYLKHILFNSGKFFRGLWSRRIQ